MAAITKCIEYHTKCIYYSTRINHKLPQITLNCPFLITWADYCNAIIYTFIERIYYVL